MRHEINAKIVENNNNKQNSQSYTSSQEVIIERTFTANNKDDFLIYDNKRFNRIVGFCSPIGLRMLAESKTHHSDGTFHTKSKYFGQLYVFHAFFEVVLSSIGTNVCD